MPEPRARFRNGALLDSGPTRPNWRARVASKGADVALNPERYCLKVFVPTFSPIPPLKSQKTGRFQSAVCGVNASNQ